MNFAENIKRLRQERGLTQRELGEIAGVSDKAVSTWELGLKEPRSGVMARLAQYFGVTRSALLGDDPLPEEGFPIAFERLANAWGRTPERIERDIGLPHFRMMALRRGEDAPTDEELDLFVSYFHVPRDILLNRRLPQESANVVPLPKERRGARRVPVLGRVPAGIPLEAVNEVVEELELDNQLSHDGHEYFGLLVTGDSMFPEYRDGDVVILRVQSTAETGDDVVAYIGGSDATLKRIAVSDEGIELRPLNPMYPTRAFSAAEVEALPVTLAGVVVEQRRRHHR